MPSVTEQSASRKAAFRRFGQTFALWNRKLHYYIGLLLLFFLWLFAFTGLLLNHPAWTFAEFWSNRKQTDLVRHIQPPPPGGDLEQAKDIMRQLGIHGEIEWATTRADLSRFEFQVNHPGHSYKITADLTGLQAAVHTDELNGWGVMRVLHTFTGVRMSDSKNQRDWALTSIWAYSMDAVAAGLIVMVCSSYYMWWVLIRKRKLGLVALALGTVGCGLFAIGLRWITT
jgi:hypothetical protein